MIVFIRPYQDKDLQKLIEVYKQVFAGKPYFEIWTTKEVREDLEMAFSQELPIVLVAEDRDGIVGFTRGYKLPFEKFPFLEGISSDNSSYIDELAVLEDKRRKGIGIALSENYKKIAKNQKISELVLRTEETSEPAMNLYKKLRFESLGIYDPRYPTRVYLRRLVR